VNNTSRYLWESVERLRDELAIGRDYFQLHVCALALQRKGRLLVVQQNGRWTFPGTYLIVGDQWRDALSRMLSDRFGVIVAPESMAILTLETESSERVPEAAVAKAFAVMQVDASNYEFSTGERYKAARWLQNPRMIDELTFVDELTRDQAAAAFRWFARR
jgi:ADP-ribose pyrophosphatase YjhB (NUDIX family)